jgi:hypothetical protein
MQFEHVREGRPAAELLGDYSFVAFSRLVERGRDGEEIALRGDDGAPKEVPTEEDFIAKGMALDELSEAVKRMKQKSDTADKSKDLDDDTKKVVKRLYKKAIAKIEKAIKDLLEDYLREVNLLPEGTEAEKKAKEALKKSHKQMTEKFEKESGLEKF